MAHLLFSAAGTSEYWIEAKSGRIDITHQTAGARATFFGGYLSVDEATQLRDALTRAIRHAKKQAADAGEPFPDP